MSLPEFTPEEVEKLLRMGRPPHFFDDAFTARVLKEMSEQSLLRAKTPRRLQREALNKLKISVMVRFIKKEPPETKLPAPKAGDMLTNEQIEKMLIEDKFLTPDKEPTPSGRQFVEDYEKSQRQEK